LTDNAKNLFTELGVRDLSNVVANNEAIATASKDLALITLVDIGIFFAVLMLGFAYVWRRGDLDWVKAAIDERKRTRAPQLESKETS
jgi:NADH-quinone oxidoreductase subunit A